MNAPWDLPVSRPPAPREPAPAVIAPPGGTPYRELGNWGGAACVTCNRLASAKCLYRTTLELLSGRDADAAAHRLCSPLTRVVSQQKSRDGQADCARFAVALAASDYPAALDACQRLIAREQGNPMRPR